MALMGAEQQLSFARGMNDTSAPTEYLSDECELVQNGRVSFDGQTVERRGGSERLHAAALNSGAQCYGGIEFYTAAGVQQLVVFMGNKMYTSIDDGATWSEQATGLTQAYWSLVIMREGASNVLCAANGGTSSYQWNGTTWAVITNIPDDVKFLAVFGNRLYAAGHSGITVQASKVGDIETWATPDGLLVQAQTHDGDAFISGLFTLGTVLLVFKENSVGYVEGYGFNTLEVEAGSRGISRSVGCIAHRTIKPAGGQGLCWLSKRGIEYYELGGRITLATRSIQQFVDGINFTQLESTPGTAVGMWWPQKHEYWCAVPVGGTQNDWMIGYRPPHGEGNQESHPPAVMLHKYAAASDDTLFTDTSGYLDLSTSSDREQGQTLSGYLLHSATGGQFMTVDASGHLDFATTPHDHAALFLADTPNTERATSPISCGYDGFVRLLESGNTDNSGTGLDDGEAITFRLVTRPFFFGQAMRPKKARIIRIASQQESSATLQIIAVGDGLSGTSHTLTQAGSSKPITGKSRVGKKGVSLQVQITTTDLVKISAVEIAAKVLAEPW